VLSVASVRSAGGAANYFAKDDYYVGEHASEVSGWGGRGAAELGLSGEVDKRPSRISSRAAYPMVSKWAILKGAELAST
jgi:hypothetical protein